MSAEPHQPAEAPASPSMPTRPLGRTGHQVGLFSLGGQAIIEQANSADLAVEVVHRALELGVNYIDTAPRYTAGARESERNIGHALRGHRQRVFLATKTHDRSRDGSLKLLDESLELLHTDHVDLWQLHNIQHREEMWPSEPVRRLKQPFPLVVGYAQDIAVSRVAGSGSPYDV